MEHESPFVSIEEVMQETALTQRQIRFDITHGYLPGSINHRGRLVIRREGPDSWNAYLRGEWLPAEPGSHKKPSPKTPKVREEPIRIYRRNIDSSGDE